MKLIIDIPERDYDLACKYPNALIATYAHYIKDGTPYEERPQGEWGKWIISVIKCPDCLECFHFPTEHYSMEMLKECPNCGADMRKDNRLTKEQLENVWDSGYVKTEVEDWYEEGD